MASLYENTSATSQPQNNQAARDHRREAHTEERQQQPLPATPPHEPAPLHRDSDPFGGSREGSAASGHLEYSAPRVDTASRGPQPQPSLRLHESPSSIERFNEKQGERETLNSNTGILNRGAGNRNSDNSGQALNLPFNDITPRQGDNNSQNGEYTRGRTRDNDMNVALPPLPPQAARGEGITLALPGGGLQRQRTGDTRQQQSRRPSLNRRQSAIDWIVPTAPMSASEPKASTLAQRLQPTIDVAIAAKDKYVAKAKWTGWTLNGAIGLQVLLGSLTTGLSAVATSGGKSTAVSTTILGALATLVASYLARARGSNEPELSIARVKDLEQFIRECEAFKMDHGHITTNELDRDLEEKRRRFEELLGNANGERKLSPPV